MEACARVTNVYRYHEKPHSRLFLLELQEKQEHMSVKAGSIMTLVPDGDILMVCILNFTSKLKGNQVRSMKTGSKKMTVKIWLGIGIFAILCWGLIYYNLRSYLPELPIEGMTKKEVYQKVVNQHNSIIFLQEEKGYNWYIYQGNPLSAREELVKRFNTLGFYFKDQMGSGYFFGSKDMNKEIIVGSQKWTSKFIIFQMPGEIKI